MSEPIPTQQMRDNGLIACHVCDALCRDVLPKVGQKVRCPRCDTILRTARRGGIDLVLALALAILVLMIAALSTPFLGLAGRGLSHDATVIDAALALGDRRTWPLAIAVFALIAAIPMARAAALAWVLIPLRLGRAALPGARRAFRLAIELRPWSMAEIFVIGVSVALVKVAGLASVDLGPAFWLFVLLGVLAIAEDIALCQRTVWSLLE